MWRRRRSRVIAFAMAPALAVSSNALSEERCPGHLNEQLAPGFELGKSILFENEMYGTECRSLRFQGRHIAWGWRFHADGPHQYLFKCFRFSEEAPFRLEPGASYGSADDQLSAAVVSGTRVEVAALAVPGWSMLSNPSFSGYRVAYWSSEGDSTHASVFDLRTKKVLVSQFIAAGQAQTDNSNHFERPEWLCTGKHVAFVPHEPARPLVLTVPE